MAPCSLLFSLTKTGPIMRSEVTIEVSCGVTGCNKKLSLSMDTASWYESGSVAESIIGVSTTDIACKIHAKGWSITKMSRRGIANWEIECFKHGMSNNVGEEIDHLAEEEGWSEEFKKGFARAVSQHPKIDETDNEWLR